MSETTTTVGERPGDQWAMPRGVIVLLGIAGVVIAVAGLRAVASIVGPVFLALIITIGVAPVGAALRKRGAPGWVATVASTLVAFGILFGFALVMAYAAIKLAELIPQYSDKFNDLTKTADDFLAKVGVTQDQIDAALNSFSLSDVSKYLIQIFGAITSVVSNFTFMLLVLFFLLMDQGSFANRLGVSRRLRPDIGRAMDSFVSGTRSYLIVSTVFGAIVGVLDAGALALMGIPAVVLWGLISFITNYIPNIGFVLGVIPPAVIGLLQGGPGLAIAVIVVYSGINFVIQSLIQPRFTGDAVNLATTVTFLSMVLWTWIIGPIGALLAIPLTLLAKALLIDIDPATRWAGLLLQAGQPSAEDIARAEAAEAVDRDESTEEGDVDAPAADGTDEDDAAPSPPAPASGGQPPSDTTV